MQDAAGEIQPALHPARVGADDIVGPPDQSHGIESAVDRLAQLGAAEIVHPAPEVKILARGQIEVEGDGLRRDADKSARRSAGVDIDANDRDFPGVARAPFGLGLLIVRGSAPQDTKVFMDGVEIPLIFHFGALTAVAGSLAPAWAACKVRVSEVFARIA